MPSPSLRHGTVPAASAVSSWSGSIEAEGEEPGRAGPAASEVLLGLEGEDELRQVVVGEWRHRSGCVPEAVPDRKLPADSLGSGAQAGGPFEGRSGLDDAVAVALPGRCA